MEWFLFLSVFIIQNIKEAFSTSNGIRLSNEVLPQHYDISLRPDIYHNSSDDYTLYGNVTIYAIAASRIDNVRLHSVNLTIVDIAVFHQTLNVYKDHIEIESEGEIIINLSVPVMANDALKMVFNYSGPIRHNLHGLYYFHSEDDNVGVTTQLEAIHAREVFPCFDEPSFKATFNVSVYRKSPYRGISNGALLRTIRLPDDWNVDVFQMTPRMSTYLVAVVVTTDTGTSKLYRDVNITIYYPKHKEHETQFAMNTTILALEKFEEFLGIKYPLSKLDSYGFNKLDYKYGGMENYGLITYASHYLYSDGANFLRLRYIAFVVLHEVAHQWFGNLVTMKWWPDLWLNEGFASYFSVFRSKWMSKFRLRDYGIVRTFYTMMEESFTEQLPVTYFQIHSEATISKAAGPITYDKGGMMVQMLELLLGEDVFRYGLQTYLRKHQYSSVSNQDLLSAMSLAAEGSTDKINVNNVFIPWLSQTGFPIVSISFNNTDNTLTFSQRPAGTYDKGKNKLWPIPIQWKIDGGAASKIIVKFNALDTVQINEDLNNNIVVVNPEANFYYVVEYELDYMEKLLEYIKRKEGKIFDPDTRAKLLFDTGFLSKRTENEANKKEYGDIYQRMKEIFNGTANILDRQMINAVCDAIESMWFR